MRDKAAGDKFSLQEVVNKNEWICGNELISMIGEWSGAVVITITLNLAKLLS